MLPARLRRPSEMICPRQYPPHPNQLANSIRIIMFLSAKKEVNMIIIMKTTRFLVKFFSLTSELKSFSESNYNQMPNTLIQSISSSSNVSKRGRGVVSSPTDSSDISSNSSCISAQDCLFLNVLKYLL